MADRENAAFSWDSYGNDLVAWAEHIGLAGAIAAGHSMGGYALTDAAASKPEVFSRLLLVDPVILPPALYAERASGPQDPSAHPRPSGVITGRTGRPWRRFCRPPALQTLGAGGA